MPLRYRQQHVSAHTGHRMTVSIAHICGIRCATNSSDLNTNDLHTSCEIRYVASHRSLPLSRKVVAHVQCPLAPNRTAQAGSRTNRRQSHRLCRVEVLPCSGSIKAGSKRTSALNNLRSRPAVQQVKPGIRRGPVATTRKDLQNLVVAAAQDVFQLQLHMNRMMLTWRSLIKHMRSWRL